MIVCCSFMSLTYVTPVTQQVSIPLKYAAMFSIIETLKISVDAKLEEWVGSDGVTISNLNIIHKFLTLLMRVIPDPDVEPEKKWVIVCGIFDKYVDNWSQMFNSLRYRKIQGCNEDEQKRKTLNMRKDFKRLFALLGEFVTDEIEIQEFSTGNIDLNKLRQRLTSVE